MTRKLGFSFGVMACVLALGCGEPVTSADAGIDAPMECVPFETPVLGDAGTIPTAPHCPAPDGGTPGTGPCCYRASQAGSLDAPELRLAYIDIDAPEGSLTSSLLLGILNDAIERESFNWLFRVEGAEADGPVTLRTGFGFGEYGGPYQFPTGAGTTPFDIEDYLPVEIPGTMTGEIFSTGVYAESLTVPVLNTEGTAVQLQLVLRNIRVIGAEAHTDRSCVGFVSGRGYASGAVLDGFIEVDTARTGQIVLPTGGETTVCSAIAGSLSMPTYCDRPQGEWDVPPDSLCPETGECTVNTGCEEDVCDREDDGSSGLPACNAWRLVARFAAQGVEISN